MRRYYSKVRIAHAPAGTLLEMVDGVWCLTKGSSKVLLAFGKDFDPDMWSGDFEEVTQGFEAIDTVKESTEEDRIAEGKVDEEQGDEVRPAFASDDVPPSFRGKLFCEDRDPLMEEDEPPEEIEELGTDLNPDVLLAENTSKIFELIKAVNYLLKKQR